jgi:radical SAM superfamily enzyme YgiQ (UPF0313 family)
MKVKFILPALTEAKSPLWRPIKYSLFPPLGLATLAAFLAPEDEAELVDDHVEPLSTDDRPDLVVIQVYITNAYRAYALADHYRAKGCRVVLGGLHVTSLPDEAAPHADTIFLGPGEQTFPQFLRDLRDGCPKPRYVSTQGRTLHGLPPVRRGLIKRDRYLVPNSIVVTRGCPQHCDFCYKDAFFTAAARFMRSASTKRWRKSNGCPVGTCIFSTIICWVTGALPLACSKGCAAWGACFRGQPPSIPSCAAI